MTTVPGRYISRQLTGCAVGSAREVQEAPLGAQGGIKRTVGRERLEEWTAMEFDDWIPNQRAP